MCSNLNFVNFIDTGGKAILWETSPVPVEELATDIPEYLFIEDISAKQETKDANKSFYRAIEHLKSNGRRSIPLQEIALAILYCSCQRHCNSKFNIIENILPVSQRQGTSQVLVYETQETTQKTTQSERFISETLNENTLNFPNSNIDSQNLKSVVTKDVNSTTKDARNKYTYSNKTKKIINESNLAQQKIVSFLKDVKNDASGTSQVIIIDDEDTIPRNNIQNKRCSDELDSTVVFKKSKSNITVDIVSKKG